MVELDLLGVDQHEPHLVRAWRAAARCESIALIAPDLPAPGRAGHEQVRHLRQVGADRLAGHVLAQPHRQRRPVLRRLLEDVAEAHDPAVRVGHLHADRLLAGDRREDADVGRRQRVGEVVLQLGHLRDLRPRRQPQLIARDVRSGDGADHLRLHAEVPERLDQARRDALLPGGVRARLLAGRARQQLPASGSSQTKSGSSVTASRSRPCGVSAAAIGVGDARRSPPRSSSVDRSSADLRSASVHGLAREPAVALQRLARARARSSCDGPSTWVARTTSSSGAGSGTDTATRSAASSPRSRAPLARGVARPRPARPRVRARAHHARRVGETAAGRAERAGERGSGQQDHAGEQQEHDEDADPDALHEPVGRLEERFAGDAAVRLQVGRGPGRIAAAGSRAHAERAGRERERDRGEQADRACPQRALSAGSTGRSSSTPPPTTSATGASTRARPSIQPSATARPCPAPPPSQPPYRTNARNTPTATSASPSTSRPRWSSTGRRGRIRASESLSVREPAGAPAPARRAGALRRPSLARRARALSRAFVCWPSRATSTPNPRNLPWGLTIALAPTAT